MDQAPTTGDVPPVVSPECQFTGTPTQITGVQYPGGEPPGPIYAIERFVRSDRTLRLKPEILAAMIDAYLGATPTYARALVIRPHPTRPVFYVTDAGGVVNLGELMKTDFVGKVDAEDPFAAGVTFADIAANTARGEREAQPAATPVQDKTREAWRLTPRRAMGVGIAALLVLIAACRVIHAFGGKEPGFEPVTYDETAIDLRLQGTEASLTSYPKIKKMDEPSGASILREAEWFLDHLKDGRLTEPQRAKASELRKTLAEVKHAD